MEKTFENITNKILKDIKNADYEIQIYTNDLNQPDVSNIKRKKLNRWIDDAVCKKITLELVLRKFYSWSEIKELENE